MRNDTPVLMEWYSNWIPSSRNALIVKYGLASRLLRAGADVQIKLIDPSLHNAADVIVASQIVHDR